MLATLELLTLTPLRTDKLRVIDAHHHLWRYSAIEYEWIDDRMATLRRDFLPADFIDELANAGDRRCCYRTSAADPRRDAVAAETRKKHKEILGVVGWAPIASTDFEASLHELAEARNS